MDLAVVPSEGLSGEISPAPSKFYTQFASATAFFAEGKSTIESPLQVSDTRVLVHALEEMGAEVKRTQDKWFIWGVEGNPTPKCQAIDAKKSAMNLSLMTSLASLAPYTMVVTCSHRLRTIPMPSLINALQHLGVDLHSTKWDESPPFVIFGRELEGGKVSLNKNMDPYFLPALLLLAPVAENRVELVLRPCFRSCLLDMAVEILKEGGIEVSVTQRRLRVSSGGFKPLHVRPPLDMVSIAPYITAAVLTNSKLKISKINEVENAPSFITLFKKIGVEAEKTSESVTFSPSRNFRGKKISLENFPELLPFVSVLACSASGKTRIMDAKRARKMKSDRIAAMAEGLKRMGAKIIEHDDGLTIEGPVDLKGAVVDGHDDDAVVAALGVAGLAAEGKTTVKNRAEALHESYPRFVSIFRDLGGEMSYEV